MPASQDENITFRDAEIIFKNFAGKEGPYNAEGVRTFGLKLSDEDATILEQQGWKVKYLKVREEGDTPQAWMEITLKYEGRNGYKPRPPTVMLITNAGKARTPLDDTMLEIIDYTAIAKVDLIVRPYDWSMNGKHGRKAYLKSIYITVAEDELELEYNQIPLAGSEQLALGSGEEEIWDAEIVQEDTLAIEA